MKDELADTATHGNAPDGPIGFERVERASYRPVRLIGLLLLLEAAGLVGVIFLEHLQVRLWVTADALRKVSLREIEVLATDRVLASALFIPTAALALLGALSFLILFRRGWVLAAMSQGLGLVACLWLYSQSEPEPVYVYPITLYCILLVFYLNSRTVRALFQPGQAPKRRVGRP